MFLIFWRDRQKGKSAKIRPVRGPSIAVQDRGFDFGVEAAFWKVVSKKNTFLAAAVGAGDGGHVRALAKGWDGILRPDDFIGWREGLGFARRLTLALYFMS